MFQVAGIGEPMPVLLPGTAAMVPARKVPWPTLSMQSEKKPGGSASGQRLDLPEIGMHAAAGTPQTRIDDADDGLAGRRGHGPGSVGPQRVERPLLRRQRVVEARQGDRRVAFDPADGGIGLLLEFLLQLVERRAVRRTMAMAKKAFLSGGAAMKSYSFFAPERSSAVRTLVILMLFPRGRARRARA